MLENAHPNVDASNLNPDQSRIDRLVKIRRGATVCIVVVLILGGIDVVLGVRSVFLEASKHTSIGPGYLANELSKASYFGLFTLICAGFFYIIRIWAVLRLRFFGVSSELSLHPSRSFLKHRLRMMLDDDD